MADAAQAWLDLREELVLHTGPNTTAGAPTWTLHDPIRNLFFRIERKTFEILSRWEQGAFGKIAELVRRDTGLEVTQEDVTEVATFVRNHGLVQAHDPSDTAFLMATLSRGKSSWTNKLLKNYLFVRIPLLRPDRFLAATYPWLSWLFEAWVRCLLAALGVAGAYLVMRQWDVFKATLIDLFTIEGMVWFAVALVFAKIIHEMGHAYTAHRYGCRVASMGIAFIVMWPVLYTDVTDAWKLSSRRARMYIGSAGMATEISLAVLATLLWSFFPDGPMRTALFLVATTTWIGTLAINIMPFLRFDGYYLLSDWLGIDNLFARSFALGRWKLRETLFGLSEPIPEHLPAGMRRFLITFAFGVWVYRFFLFLGIALLVYHFFFKLLGILLMAVEVWWFIMRPVVSEMSAWWQRRSNIRWNPRTITTFVSFLVVLGLFFVPWRSTVELPALLTGAKHAYLFAPREGKVATVAARMGERVEAGATLAVLQSSELDYQLTRAKREAKTLQWEIANAGASGRFSVGRIVAEGELRTVRQKMSGVQEQQRRLVISSPIAGIVTQPQDDLLVGQWVSRDAALFKVVDFDRFVIEGYVRESDLGLIGEGGAKALFFPDIPELPKITSRLTQVESTAIATLSRPSLASVHGGLIAARQLTDGSLVPEEAYYRVFLDPVGDTSSIPKNTLRGVVMVSARPRSLAERAKTIVWSVLVRESGF